MIASGIYTGTLRHRRFRPRSHIFTYPLFLAFLDIDRLPELMSISPLASYNRCNVISYLEADHFGDSALPLRERLRLDPRRPSVGLGPREPVFLLTHLRTFGYNFNPVSFYYHYSGGEFRSVMAEVNNTFGETENYWLNQDLEVSASMARRYRFNKSFHVSPFMPLNQIYDWTFSAPGEDLVVECMSFENGDLVFDSTLKLRRREWTRHELHRAIAEFPLMTMRVIAGIHWQALRLALKGVPGVAHPGKGIYTRRNKQELGASWKTH
jgi:uncharacterized protein